jgi:TetR/AcrR family transcriptional regulator
MKKRAIQSEDKEKKRKQIVSSAKELFDEREFFAVKMEDVAHKAGLAKGTLYLYFATKEELFLAVAQDDLELWFEHLHQVLAAHPDRSHVEPQNPYTLAKELTEFLANSFTSHPKVPRDLSLIFNVLEHNVGADKLDVFKKFLVDRLEELCDRFAKAMNAHSDASWHLQLAIQALILGAWQLAYPREKDRNSGWHEPTNGKRNPAFQELFAWSLENLFAGFLQDEKFLR